MHCAKCDKPGNFVRLEFDQYINVTIGAEIITQHGAEQR